MIHLDVILAQFLAENQLDDSSWMILLGARPSLTTPNSTMEHEIMDYKTNNAKKKRHDVRDLAISTMIDTSRRNLEENWSAITAILCLV